MPTKAPEADMAPADRLATLEQAVENLTKLVEKAVKQPARLNVALDPRERVLGLKKAFDKATSSQPARHQRTLVGGRFQEGDIVKLLEIPDKKSGEKCKARMYMDRYELSEPPIGVIELVLPQRKDGTAKYNVHFPEIRERDGIREDELEAFEGA